MAPSILCRYYNTPSGCRNGSACRFVHSRPPDNPFATPSRALTPTSPSWRQRDGGARLPPDNPFASPSRTLMPTPPSWRQRDGGARAPPGVCTSFWNTGLCRFEFACRYEHRRAPEAGGADSDAARSSWRTGFALRSAATTPTPAADAVAPPFLTESGLARLVGAGTDVFFGADGASARTPSQVHAALRRFLHDDYRFSTTLDIYAFLVALSSAQSTNATWTPEEGQLLLEVVASDKGLTRIRDMIGWSPVSTKAGQSTVILSFQRAYVPLLKYLSSDFVVKSTQSKFQNALFLCVLGNIEAFADVVERSMSTMMNEHSFRDPAFTRMRAPFGNQILVTLASLLFECLTRFKNSVQIYPRLSSLVDKLEAWTEEWVSDVESTLPKFESPFQDSPQSTRDFVLRELRKKVALSVNIVKRERELADHSKQEQSLSQFPVAGPSEGIVAALRQTYEGPGTERKQGPRHDNDFVDIDEIRIAPTHDELVSRTPPFLPANIYNAPHPYPADSMQRLLDIQFRLLREELTAPLRASIQLVLDDLQRMDLGKKTRLGDILKNCGGKYRGPADSQESVIFNIYTNVAFKILTPDRRGITVAMSLDTPPGRARSTRAQERRMFWDGAGGKRLMQGGLVALVWRSGNNTSINLGTLATSTRDLSESAARSPDTIDVRVAFFDPEVELRILQSLKSSEGGQHGELRLLVESPVLFEAIRPFLEALRVEPTRIPFSKYLVHHPPGYLRTICSDPPLYATTPGFSYDLSGLFFSAGEEPVDLRMSMEDQSVAHARQALREGSRLDPSQADAIVDALTREVALIQGPPGTGKSYTGVELLRVLVANKLGPILMIAFTNHALDHMLSSVLDAGITINIVRLGSRSADERLSQYSMETRELAAGQSRLDRSFAHRHRDLKVMQEAVTQSMEQLLRSAVDPAEISQSLELNYPEHHSELVCPPRWVSALQEISLQAGGGVDAWRLVGPHGRERAVDDSLYDYWVNGRDLEFLRSLSLPAANHTQEDVGPANKYAILSREDSENELAGDEDISPEDSDDSSSEDDGMDAAPEEAWKKSFVLDAMHPEEDTASTPTPPMSNPSRPWPPTAPVQPRSLQLDSFQGIAEFLRTFDLPAVPVLPSTTRPLNQLLLDGCGRVWDMSLIERQRLHKFWVDQVRSELFSSRLDDFKRLREQLAGAQRSCEEGKEESRRQLLADVDIIGCTTTGAAKLTSLLQGIGPRIVLVEEAGQVLEAHVLGSLVAGSVLHLIMIGDPLQLRPTIANYSLSVNSRRGNELYKFDQSLMERLALAGLPMSRINVQRRMRPTISHLIRKTLYSGLEDHEIVTQYPPVRGLAKNVFFFNHSHAENKQGEESESRHNMFEVLMIKDLVLHLLRQGCYTNDGDIVVLCGYLGQLARMRDAFSNEFVVVLDERDKVALDDQAEDPNDGAPFTRMEEVKLTSRVRLRTIDNYQGEEGKIIILSLVRNSGAPESNLEGLGRDTIEKANIGFLRSENRTNVALSRAREGLIIFGNTIDLSSRSQMWRSIIEELESQDAVGDALPVTCNNHPQAIEYISEPGKLQQVSPDGGCLRPCGTRLQCGHMCPYKCHPDDPQHIHVRCSQSCARLCLKGHPCDKPCAEACGDCKFLLYSVELPCGHSKENVPCYLSDKLEDVTCDVLLEKMLPHCEHTTAMRCSDDPENYRCKATCKGVMACCGRDCRSQCHACQGENLPTLGQVPRKQHCKHGCQKPLYCQHLCKNPCSEEHTHSQFCTEPCRQMCPHARCQKPCSTPCAPCLERCTWVCDHFTCPVPCGSVCARLPCDKRCKRTLRCGHRCPSVCGEPCDIQQCPICISEEGGQSIVDLVMQRSLADIDPDLETLDELVITLPQCRHVFTVETLDGHCGITDYYGRRSEYGPWLNCKEPPLGYKQPPVCPTCRTAITSPRYGRIFKRADLDILERNVASQLAQLLDESQAEIGRVSTEDMKANLKRRIENIPTSKSSIAKAASKARRKNREKILKVFRETPVPLDSITPTSTQYHVIPDAIGLPWGQVIAPLMLGYSKALKAASTRSSHIQAWEAAFHSIFNQESEAVLKDPVHAPRRPREHAMRMAKIKVGHPQPRADKRFIVEAFWITLSIRFTLVELVLSCVNRRQTAYWEACGLYADFLLNSCVKDAQIALNIARGSEAHRQVTKTSLFIMRANLEKFRFQVEMSRANNVLLKVRSDLSDTAADRGVDAKRFMAQVIDSHYRAKPSVPAENRWLQENFSATAQVIIDQWIELERSIRQDVFYQPVSLDDKMEIVRALNFTHTGHFYNCPNGHTFIITECGGATQRACCPEYGETIGGTNHDLDSRNTRATEYEELLRQQGAQRSPFSWGN